MDLRLGYFVVTFISCFKEVYTSCDSYDVNSCMEPILSFRRHLQISDDVSYFPIYKLNDKQLKQYCRYGDAVVQCLNGLSDCTGTDRELFRGVQDSVHFLCVQTLQEYQSYQSCYSRPQVVSGLELCDKDSSEKIRSVNTGSYGAKDRLCSIVKGDFECNRNAVKMFCGDSAAKWQVNYIKKVVNPMINQVGCNGLPQWATIVIIAMVIAVCIAIAVIGVYFRRRRNAGKASGEQFNNVLAPSRIA